MKNITATKKIIEPKTVQDRKIFIVRNIESIISSIILREPRPTACVTCAGVGTAKPSNWENDKA